MISLVTYFGKKIASKFTNTGCNTNIEHENVRNILNEINDIRLEVEDHEEDQENYSQPEAGCYQKYGFITVVTNDYVMIDDNLMCERKFINVALKKGDRVFYLCYKASQDQEMKVRRILRKECNWEMEMDDDTQVWDSSSAPQNAPIEPNEEQPYCINILEENMSIPVKQNIDIPVQRRSSVTEVISDVIKKTIIKKVERRVGRNVFVEGLDFPINLDETVAGFVVCIGDWLKIECLCESDKDKPGWREEVLEILSIEAARGNRRIGFITAYDETKGVGTIDKEILFTKETCIPGYVPYRNDKVIVQFIESDQGRQEIWRALNVAPTQEEQHKFSTAAIRYQTQMPEDELKTLCEDKENIEITNCLNIVLDAKTEQEFQIKVRNNGNQAQKLLSCVFNSRKCDSQLTLNHPDKNEIQTISPSQEVIYKFTCKGRLVGESQEVLAFKFKGFKIGRVIKIKVNCLNFPKQIQSDDNINCYRGNNNFMRPETYEEGTYIRGVKPYKPAKFITNPTRPPRIPNLLLSIVENFNNRTRAEQEFMLADKIPLFKEPLTFKNYREKFIYLLHLEQLEQTNAIKKFDMSRTVLRQHGEFITLDVPGLAEKRPSLIVGDKIVVSFQWDSSKGEKYYEGFIHKIKRSIVFLKFDSSFHGFYNGEHCQVSFKASHTVINRCYTAVSEAVTKLGEEFLFPKKVQQKEPQYNFIDDDDDNYNEDIDPKDNVKELVQNIQIANGCMSANDEIRKEIMSMIKNKKISWINKKLNEYQKEAVRNILKGVARPLPYIIFGPPGTGKTITVCEAILQILSTMPESRILVATPSNSSANLIAERLLDSKILKPGEMIRLVAHHYLESDLVPKHLLPYCVTADISAEGSRKDVNLNDPRGCRTNLTLSVLCHHPIIIGTCSAMGILFNMGCKAGHFTHVIIDEAGQATEPEIMIPLSLIHASSTQVILAGDPKQLGPVNQSRVAGFYGLDESFLSRLKDQNPYLRDPEGFKTGYDPRLVTKLRYNYRSLPELLELPNKLFYDDELIAQVHPDDSEEALLLESLKDMLPQKGRLGGPPAMVFHGVDGKNLQEPDSPSWYNQEEATQVYIYLLDLYNRGLKPEDIGVITPYSKQVYKIKSALADFDVEIPKVGSVEEFQGQERKVIILSTVRTAEDKIHIDTRHALGFVSAGERLNVAITRARSLLIIIGSPKLLQKDKYWRSVLDRCLKLKSYKGCDFK